MRKNALMDLTGNDYGIWHVVKQAPRQDNKTRWICVCRICGAERSKVGTRLRIGQYHICFGRHPMGRPSFISPLRKPPGWAAASEVYGRYKLTAKARGFTFDLRRDQFMELVGQDCHYCGMVPMQVNERRHFNGAFVYNGIDRKDSSRGYEIDNCLPACASCNVMKQDLPYDVFLSHIALIHSRHPATPVRLDCDFMSLGSKRPGLQANVSTRQIIPTLQERAVEAKRLKALGRTIDEIGIELNLARTQVFKALADKGGNS